MARSARSSWPDYRAVWRWHFYAGVFCIPFVVILAISGAIYLFKGEIEAWEERQYDALAVSRTPSPASAQVAAALAAFPGSRFEGYELPARPGSAARVLLRHVGGEGLAGAPARPGAGTLRTYVDPASAAVLGSAWERDRLMKIMFRLHGELLLGDRGSNLVELAACWTIVMVLTGLVLWWPRHWRGLAGVVWPRFHGGRRLLMRDLHAVTAAWLSVFTLLLLASGLPWAQGWGDWLKTVRSATGTAAARQEWSNSTGSAAVETGSGDHGHGGGAGRGGDLTGADHAALDRVVSTVTPLGLAAPVVIARAGSDRWTAKSLVANRPRRVNLVLAASTGAVVSREDFATKHPIDKAVAVGIAFHEGRLFGWPNQLLGLLTTIGLVVACASAVWLWLRRRDPGTLGAPPPGVPAGRSVTVLAAVGLLGLLLPLFGLSVVAVVVVEWAVLARVPSVARWLGLRPAP